MRKILTLIFGALIALPAICQTDSVYLFSTGQGVLGDSIFLPSEFFRRGAAVPKLLKISLRKAKIQNLNMGMDAMYIPESDVVGGNASRSITKVLTYMVPVSIQVTQAQLDSISKYIKKITEPVVVPKPDIITNVDDTPSTGIAYMLNATTPYNGTVNTPDWSKWTHFKDNAWNADHLNKTASFGYALNSYFTVSWTGYKIEWYAEKRVNHGIAAVSIDGGPEQMIDLYKNTQANGKEVVFTWTATNPTNAAHTIKVRVTGTKNAAATENNISNDYLKIFKRP